MPVIAQDRQLLWKPVFLVDVDFPSAVTKHFCSGGDTDALTTAYEGRLIEPPVITRKVPDALYGIMEVQDVRIRVSNKNGDLTSGYTGELRGRNMRIRRYDRYSGTTITEWTGIVSAAGLDAGELWIEGSNINLASLDEPFPRNGLVTTATWASAKDVGAVIPLTFGNHTKVPLPYVNEDQTNDIYDYLIGFDDALAGVTASALFRRSGDTLFAVEANRKVIIDSRSQSKFTGVSSSWTHTCTGSDRLLIVYVSMRSSSVSSITYNGVALTKIDHVAGTNARTEIWYTLNPPKGAFTVAVTAGASTDAIATAVSFNGVLQSMGTSDFAFASATGNSTTPSVTVTGADANDMVYDCLTVRAVSATTIGKPGAGQSLLWNEQQGTNTIWSLGSQETGAGADVMNWTTGIINQWAIAAILIKPAPTYTVNRAAYSGYVVARFTYRQTDGSGGTLPIYADITGMSVERNFAKAIESVLSNATWGLSQTVNASSFSTAATALNTIGSLFCDGSLYGRQVTAREVLQDLLMPRGMRLTINASGEWIIAVDAQQTDTRMIVKGGVATGDGEKNVVRIGNRTVASIEQATSEFVLQYRWDEPTSKYLFEQKRTTSSFGSRRIEVNRFVRDHTTADKIAHYLGKRVTYAQETLTISLPQEARQLSEGELIEVTYAPLGLSAVTLEVQEVRKKLDQIEAVLRLWNADIYGYSAGTLPSDSTLGSPDDYSHTPPSPATNLTIVASGTGDVDGDGKVEAWVKLKFDTPTTNILQAIVKWRRTGDVFWSNSLVSPEIGIDARATIQGLATNTEYEYTVSILNAFGLISVGDPTVVATSATKGTPPTAPSSVTVVPFIKSNLIAITATPPRDWGTTRLYRGTSSSFAGASEIASGKSLWFVDNNTAYGTQYWYWAKIEDTTGNLSSESSSGTTGATTPRAVTNDITDSNVTTAKIADANVTTGKIADANVTTGKIADVNVTTPKIAEEAVIMAAGTASDSTSDVGTTPTTLASVSFATETRDKVLITFKCYTEGPSTLLGAVIKAYYDYGSETAIMHSDCAAIVDASYPTQSLTVVAMLSASAGTGTFRVKGFTTTGTVKFRYRYMTVLRVRA